MNTDTPPPIGAPLAPQSAPLVQSRSTLKQKLLITACVFFGVVGVGAASATWWYQHNLNAGSFKPVQLSLAEQQEVEKKMAVIDGEAPVEASDPAKTIVLNEREINGYLQQQGLGETVKVSITKSGVGATILAPVDETVPLLGGRTIRLKVAFDTKLNDDKRFALSLADVSVGGISLPNAWLGNIKGLNLLENQQAAGGDATALNAFAAGVKSLTMRNGEMRLVLND